MKHLAILSSILILTINSFSQNVGVGELSPTVMKLQVKSTDSAVLLVHNSTSAGSDIKTGLYFKTGNNYSGGVTTIGSGATFRMGLFTFGGSSLPSLRERISILDGGNVGIGNTNPLFILDINGRTRIRHTNTTAGLWFDKTDSTQGSFIGTLNDSTLGFWGPGASGTYKMVIDVKNGNVGMEGNTTPNAPLSFANTIGNKISLYGNADAPHYGLGIQGAVMQLYTINNASDILLGYGASAAFTENARFKGTGTVGIGTNSPTEAGLVVDKKIGAVNAMFGSNTTGVAIESSYPGIGFNTYYNAGRKYIAAGGGAYIGMDPSDSKLIFSNAGGAGTAGAAAFLQDKMWIEYDGTVHLGSSNLAAENTGVGTGYKLRVYGKIISEEVRVSLKANWPDYVFSKDYRLRSFSNLENFIKQNQHLPNVPAAAEVQKSGIALGEMQTKMMEKIEELTLYVLQLNKKVEEQSKEIESLKNKK